MHTLRRSLVIVSFAFSLMFLNLGQAFGGREKATLIEKSRNETVAVCDDKTGRSICIELESHKYEHWLWFTNQCEAECTYYHSTFVNQFYPLEYLLEDQSFGMNLRKKGDGRLTWSHYRLSRKNKRYANVAEIDISYENRFQDLDGEPFNETLLSDLARTAPVPSELLRHYYSSYYDWLWWFTTHGIAVAAGVITFIVYLTGCTR